MKIIILLAAISSLYISYEAFTFAGTLKTVYQSNLCVKGKIETGYNRSEIGTVGGDCFIKRG